MSYGAGFSDLARQVLTEFGFPVPEQEAQLIEALVRCLRSGEFLLIIDNLESLLQPNREWGSQFYSEFFNAWVESGGNSKVLVTTRERPDEFHQQSLEISSEIGDRNTEGKSLMNLGNAYNFQGEYPRAIEFLQQSLEISSEIGDRNSEGKSLANLGNAYLYQGEYPRAIEFYQQSLEISREIGDRNSEGKSLANLGLAYLYQGQYPRAIEFFQRSLEISSEIGDRNSEAKAWFNLGLALENVNRESDALGAYRNARELCQTMGLDAHVQDCNDRIERLSQPKAPVVSRRGFWRWLRRLWRWVCGWFQR